MELTRRNETDTASSQIDVSGGCCKSLFRCCFQNRNTKLLKEIVPDFDTNEPCDYIVEKLVIKCIPVSLFATPYDIYEKERKEDCNCKSEPVPTNIDSQRVYSIVPATNSSLFYTSGNTPPGTSGFINGGSGKVLRFTTNEDALEAGNEKSLIYEKSTKLLDKFTALHPNLKESERAPKDPCPLNSTRSRRSLAEEISEISATKYDKTTNLSSNDGTRNVYSDKPGTSKESSSVLPDAQETSMRSKTEAGRSSHVRNRNESSSCFPFGRKSSGISIVETNEALDVDSSTSLAQKSSGNLDSPSELAKSPNYTIAPVQIHCVSPYLEKIRSIVGNHRTCVDKGTLTSSKTIHDDKLETINSRDLEQSKVDTISHKQEAQNIENLAGTTLRWKIIIKHHPPNSPRESYHKLDEKELASCRANRSTMQSK